MHAAASVRLVANLNSWLAGSQSLEQAERRITGADVAHHVVDPDLVLGLDPFHATPLDDALDHLRRAEPTHWLLALPVPGALGPLRGPAPLNAAALDIGEAAVAASGGVALIPTRTGQAVQWRAYAAERPFTPPTPGEADRELTEAILEAGTTLARLDIAAGPRPRTPDAAALAPGYPSRQQATADRATRLLVACDAALRGDGAALSAYEADRRSRELRRVRSAAGQALCAAASWIRPA